MNPLSSSGYRYCLLIKRQDAVEIYSLGKSLQEVRESLHRSVGKDGIAEIEADLTRFEQEHQKPVSSTEDYADHIGFFEVLNGLKFASLLLPEPGTAATLGLIIGIAEFFVKKIIPIGEPENDLTALIKAVKPLLPDEISKLLECAELIVKPLPALAEKNNKPVSVENIKEPTTTEERLSYVDLSRKRKVIEEPTTTDERLSYYLHLFAPENIEEPTATDERLSYYLHLFAPENIEEPTATDENLLDSPVIVEDEILETSSNSYASDNLFEWSRTQNSQRQGC